MIEPARWSAGANKYRFGFNGKENDNEVKGAGNQQDYGMRIYDTRLGRFLSVDPLQKNFAYFSPYHFAGNSPIVAVDLDGKEPKDFKERYEYVGTRQMVTPWNQDVDYVKDKATGQTWSVMHYPNRPDELYYLTSYDPETKKSIPNVPHIWGAPDNKDANGNWIVCWKLFDAPSAVDASNKACDKLETVAVAAFSSPVILIGGSELGFFAIEESFANGVGSAASNATAQFLTNGGDIHKINWVSVATNGVCANPFTANLLGTAFEGKFDNNYNFNVKVTDDNLPTVAIETTIGTAGSIGGGFLAKELTGITSGSGGTASKAASSLVWHLFGDLPASGVIEGGKKIQEAINDNNIETTPTVPATPSPNE